MGRRALPPTRWLAVTAAALASVAPGLASRPPVPRIATVTALPVRDRAAYLGAVAAADSLRLEVEGKHRDSYLLLARVAAEPAPGDARDVLVVEVWIDPAGKAACKVTVHARAERYGLDAGGRLVRRESTRAPEEEARFLAALMAALDRPAP